VRFLIDECLHRSLVDLAQAAGFEATHVNHLGLAGKPDWVLAERIANDEFTFVTNNRADFVQLFDKMALHPGLIVLVPSVAPAMQRSFPGRTSVHRWPGLANTVIELSLDGKAVRCVGYELPRSGHADSGT